MLTFFLDFPWLPGDMEAIALPAAGVDGAELDWPVTRRGIPTLDSDITTSGVDCKAQQSLSHRAWKFVSSKTLDTKIGRKLMIHSLGTEGSRITQFILKTGNEFYGENTTSEILKTVLKMIQKTQAITQGGVFDMEESRQVKEPVHDFLFEVYRVLKNSEHFFKPEEVKEEINVSNADVEALSSKLQTCLKLWATLMNSHLTQKNVQILEQAADQLSDPHFVKCVFNDPELKNFETREEFLSCLDKFLNQFQIEIGPMDAYCVVPTCGKPVLPSLGLFVGSKYCDKHHAENTVRIFKSPTLKDFVEDPDNRKFLLSYLKQLDEERPDKEIVLKLLVAISDFKKSSMLDERIKIAHSVVDMVKVLIASNPANFNKDSAQDLVDRMSLLYLQENRIPPISFWKSLVSNLEGKLESEIMPEFSKSKEFCRFVIVNTAPPPSAMPQLDRNQSNSNNPLGF
eukprot:TRINITY_DN7361_c0_g1_i1.p1 TRINITY_DN7361_c0_g1~~TRINITY_DN7361_c0_g1_i1.p1  ORF type:complete len:456 (+),score=135.92 TRINITY_DN7361_c0_g1_i1:1253-2620(+)